MTTYTAEALHVDGSGNRQVVELRIVDDDDEYMSGEAGAEYLIDGVSLGPDGPVVNVGVLTVSVAAGEVPFGAIQIVDGSDSYYVLGTDRDPNLITAFNGYTSNGAVGGILYQSYSGFDEDAAARSGQALMLDTSNGGVYFDSFTVFDDDGAIEFASETGDAPLGTSNFGPTHPGLTDFGAGDSTMVLVDVHYTTATGAGTFRAIRVERDFNPAKVFYIPKNGGPDLSTITSVTGETLVGTSLEGKNWSTYGLSTSRVVQTGGSAAEMLLGGIVNDELLGNGGADSLYGSHSADLLEGGGGKDGLFGGIGADSLQGGEKADDAHGGGGADLVEGGAGADDLFGDGGDDVLDGDGGADDLQGGTGNDTLAGGDGTDTLDGSTGADLLEGDDGDDELIGGASADTLDGGAGADLMSGEGGADTFVLVADGETDTILDFEDGRDRVDIDATFGALVITDIAPGVVQVIHNGDVLILEDGLGLLTAADLTNTDFD